MGKKKQKKYTTTVLAIVFTLLLLLVGGSFYYLKECENLELSFKEEITEVQYGMEFDAVAVGLDLESLGLDNSYELIYPNIRTNEVGEFEYVFTLKKSFFAKEFKHIVKVLDTTPPEFDVKYNFITLSTPKYNFDRNVKERITDNYDTNLSIKDMKYIGEIGDKPGIYKIEYGLSDSSGNTTSKSVYFFYKLKPENVKLPIYFEYNGEKHILANKWVPLPKSYNKGANSAARSALSKMRSAMSKAGVGVRICSAFRSYSTQRNLFNSYAKRDGVAEANRYSARAGFSEHQTGLAYDIGRVSSSFANTKAYAWLQEHAHEYGFIMRYPQGKEEITGYMYEPWHYRYLGIELATAVKQSGLTLEEFIGYTNKP